MYCPEKGKKGEDLVFLKGEYIIKAMKNIELIPLPVRKDDRGWIINLPFIERAYFHIPSLKPKAVRGNHYHEAHTETVIILGGKCLVASRNRQTGNYEEFI